MSENCIFTYFVLNELLDDCLLAIFDKINNLDDLINCYKVCVKWCHLIAVRTKKVKYFMAEPAKTEFSTDYVYYEGRCRIDVTCLSLLFPNLIIVQFSKDFYFGVNFGDVVTFVRNLESLKAIITSSREEIEKYCDKFEMLSTKFIEPHFLQNCLSLKQLHIQNAYHFFKRKSRFFPNLERLHIDAIDSFPDRYYDGPVLTKLKILELALYSNSDSVIYVFQFMDSCPNLQSAHLRLNSHRFFVDETLKHKFLQDLVIDFIDHEISESQTSFVTVHWEHKDEHIEQLVRILPNLVLLDIFLCPGVTQKAADYVTDYCKRYGRSLKFYFDDNFNEIKSDWPQLSTKTEKMGRCFDFMEHCFLKDFYHLPYFLIPISATFHSYCYF
uniref:F-box domain-containing protein n=1 Tax=Tetranychus urticae TaxID=32264 RepID=T1K8R6_TETUR